MAIAEVVVSSTVRPLVVSIVDENGNPKNLTGGSAKLQGRSRDLSAKVIDYAGTLTDPGNGVATFTNIGALVTQAELIAGGVHSATFKLRVKYTDNAAGIDYTPWFEIIWAQDPLQAL